MELPISIEPDQIDQEIDIYSAFMQLPMAIVIVKKLDYTIEYVNEFYLQLLQIKKSVIGKSLFSSFPELITQGIQALIDGVVESGLPIHLDEHEVFISRNNTKNQCFFTSDYQPIKQDDGIISGVIIIFSEVTEQVLAKRESVIRKQELQIALGTANNELVERDNEKEKRESEFRIANYARSLIEASRDPLFTINTAGKITDMNKASIDITGVSRENLIDTNFFDYFTDPGMAREAYQQVFSRGFVVDYPLTIRDHKFTDVLFNGSVYKDEQGVVLGVVVVARDVTLQKQIKRNLEKSLKEVSDYKYALDESSIVSITDHKGIIKYANDNFCTISKYRFSELVGKDHRIINSGYHPKEFMANLWETIAKGKIWKGELRNKDKDGSIYWVDTTIVPFLNDEGKPYQHIVIRTDITQLKRIEQELTEAKMLAEQATAIAREAQFEAEGATETAKNAMRSKQQFLSNMSHEIRTPMNAIIGFTKVVLKTALSSQQKEYMTAIKTSGDSLIVLINDILDLAKVDAGKMTFEKIPFKLSVSISAMLHLFETKIQEKNLLLINDYDSKIPEVLVGDPVRLHQIILNLVSNAVKFTNTGEIKLTVRLLIESEQKVTVEFLVKDTGIGINKNKLETIFENFQQASSGTARVFGGTGLGLAIVKQLVELQGGTVSVESETGKGSTFRFLLSFQKTDAAAESLNYTMELDPEIQDIKILVVEDMALNQLLMKTLLDDFGFESDIASNGKIAIEKLLSKTYDIILMDLQMPEMNGFDATQHIRNVMESNIPIIALTADVTTVDLSKCKAVGMNDYIAKPVDERILYSKIVSLVKKSVLVIQQPVEIKPGKQPVRYIDLEYLNRRTKSNPALMLEMISIYLEQTPPLIHIIKQSFQEKNWQSLYSAVHKIIPSFAIMGIHTDHETIAKKVQEYAANQQLTSNISEMVSQLENICLQACKELELELQRIKNLPA